MGLFSCKSCQAYKLLLDEQRAIHQQQAKDAADQIAFLRSQLESVRTERKSLEDSMVALADKQAFAVRQAYSQPRVINQNPEGRAEGVRVGVQVPRRGPANERPKNPPTAAEIEAGFAIPEPKKEEVA